MSATATRTRPDALAEALCAAEDLLAQVLIAIGNAKTFAGTPRSAEFDADLFSLVEELAEHGIAVIPQAAIAVAVEARAGYVLITVSGHLDEATAPQVREAVKAARTPDGYRPIAIDLTDAAVHGSKGLSPIVNAFFSTKRTADLYLVAPPKMVRRVLGQIAGGSLRVYSTVAELDDALAAESRAVTR